ncbi:HflC protein [candidate division KSB1 bacterium 4484_87]|nr:MAG: HflC protein [candidate division KSB1 bacterium 4484_87]
MNKTKILVYLIAVVLFVALIVILDAFYVIDETEQVVITQFGKPVGQPIADAGLHFKIPFVQKVNYFEKRLLEWDGIPAEILAKDKKFILVDTYARWRIANPLKFFTSVVTEDGAQTRLDNIIEAATRDRVTANVLIEVVRTSNRTMAMAEADSSVFLKEMKVDSISVGREMLSRDILKAVQEKAQEYGIEIVDVRIKRINYIDEVRQKVFERMIAERLRIAEKYRSQGMGKKAEIEGEMEKELKRIQSEAYRTAQEKMGKADAKAIKIYAQAYERDPEFYSFLKSLESYQKTMDEKTWLILSTDNDYLKYLKRIK